MPAPSNIHFYANWAKERIDEIDATLASLESKASEVQADARVKANQVLADLRKKRDAFQDTIKKQAESNEATWIRAKARLETDWTAFEADVQKYVETFGKQVEQRQATFQVRTAAQLKAWNEVADKLLARIMHHAGRFCRSDQRSRAGDPSVWIGVRPLLMQRV